MSFDFMLLLFLFASLASALGGWLIIRYQTKRFDKKHPELKPRNRKQHA